MTKFEVEFERNNVTPAQFLAYVRRMVDKKGGRYLRSDLDLAYFKAGKDLNFDTTHDGITEKSISKPYEMQTYIRYHESGCLYNEICEFTFDDDKTGHGYYYLVNISNETTETTETTEETTEETTQEVKTMTVLEALQAAKTSGCKAYKVKNHDTFGYIITPNNNILGISKSTWGAGVVFTFEYIPSQKTGSGCACMEGSDHDFGITEINAETIAHYEKEGFDFAKKLKATLYSSPAAWMEKLYWKKDIEEI